MRLPITFPIYNERTLLGLIFLFSLFISFIYLSIFIDIGPVEHQVPGTDYFVRYEPMARSILRGDGIPVGKNFREIAAPGYSFILVPIFALSELLGIHELSLIVFFNTIMAALSAVFLFLIAKSIFDTKIALIASILWSSYPLNLWFIKNPNTEVPFILFLFMATWLYIVGLKQRRTAIIFAVGILLGFAILIRPVVLFLPLLLGGALFFFKEKKLLAKQKSLPKLAFVFIFVLGAFLIVSPWIWYVAVKTGDFLPVSSVGTDTAVTGLTFAFVGDVKNQSKVSEDVRMFMERARNANLVTGMDVVGFVFKEVRTQPLPLFKLFGLKVLRSWYATYGMWGEKAIATLQLPYLLTGAFGIIFSLRKFPDRLPWIFFLLAIILYFWGMTFLTLSIVRYMVPAMGFLLIFSGVTLSGIINKLKFSL